MENSEVQGALETARSIVRAIDDTIAGRVVDDVSSFEIETNLGKRRIDKIPLADLVMARDRYRNEVARLEAMLRRKGKSPIRQVLVRF